MKNFLMVVAVALLPVGALAQDYNKGWDAYDAGDYQAALTEWRPLAEQGNALAQTNLGWMYENGNGVPQDYAEAVKWYRLAVEQGDAMAQNNLGWMYENGNGVLQSNVMAHMWYNIASANGSSKSGEYRDFRADHMTPADISEAQRRARVCMASDYQDCD